MTLTLVQMEADIAFLLLRADCAGSCNFTDDRWTGMSSNAIVAVAYGGEQGAMPYDRSDYVACVRTVRRLPAHRRTPQVMAALRAAREAYLKRYPADRYPADRKAERERLEAEHAAYLASKRRRRRR